MYIADLHIHSHYSMATSKDCTPEHLDLWARKKGIHIIGSGDFTHPAWRRELSEKLAPAEDGLYVLKKEYRIADSSAADTIQPRFIITGEISSIYKKHGRVRKVHSLILLPGLDAAKMISSKLETVGNIHSDGRPILGLDCHDLLEIVLELCPEAVYVPAHIWTPHFSLFGAFSGFDSVEECYGDLSCHIHAMETGLSSDPPMNWRISALDSYQLISNSDAHSPAKLGREASLFDIPLSYEGLKNAIQTGKGLEGTIEFFPEEGKYHYDGHRKCGICLSPGETQKYNGICPVCGKKLTIGVSHRVEQMADRPEGYLREHGNLYESLVPLPEIIGASVGHSAASAKVLREYETMLRKLGPEFSILREIPLEEIRSVSGNLISEGIQRLRKGQVTRLPGFDGEYGIIQLFSPRELDQLDGQLSLFENLLAMPAEQPDSLTSLSKTLPGKDNAHLQTADTAASPETDTPPKVIVNEHQRRAIESINRVTMVTAGPGTGKTSTLISHILYLLKIRRIKPSYITAVTFTNQAARELQERIKKEMGKGTWARKLQVGTFHSIAWKLLKNSKIEFTLAGDMETRELADKLIKEYSLDMSVSRFLTEISNYKTNMGLDACCPRTDTAVSRNPLLSASVPSPDSAFTDAFHAYQECLKEWNALDFDDLLLEALHMAQDTADNGKKGADAGPFSYLMVDEFQDINPLQYQLMHAWNKNGKELFVIGDSDQAIYGFRGADAECFQKLKTEFPNACQITLEENYRSTPQILSLASEIISQNPGGRRQLNPNRPQGSPARFVQTASEKAEAIFAAKEINRLAGGIGMLEAQELFPETEGKAWSFDDIAILYRTHRQADLLETCLKREGIPYVVAGREHFLQEPAVRGTVNFFKSLLYPENHLARETAQKLLCNLDTDRMTEKYQPHLNRKKPQKILEEWMADMDLSNDPAMDKLYQTAIFHKTMPEFIAELELGVESDLKRCKNKHYKSGAVTLMTLHGSKGLEFPVVILYGVKKGLIPFDMKHASSDPEEERRLFYVGITRARESLLLTASREESPFLANMPADLLLREKARQGKGVGSGTQMNLFEFMKG